MLKCLFMRRKLYDYFEDSLSDRDKIKIEKHLDVCNTCRDNLSYFKRIIALVAEKKMPQLDSEFWHIFKIDLDRKLNKKLASQINIDRKLRFQLKLLFAYAGALIFILAIGIGSYVYKSPYGFLIHTAQDEDLISEILTLDDLVGAEIELDDNWGVEIDEINLS